MKTTINLKLINKSLFLLFLVVIKVRNEGNLLDLMALDDQPQPK